MQTEAFRVCIHPLLYSLQAQSLEGLLYRDPQPTPPKVERGRSFSLYERHSSCIFMRGKWKKWSRQSCIHALEKLGVCLSRCFYSLLLLPVVVFLYPLTLQGFSLWCHPEWFYDYQELPYISYIQYTVAPLHVHTYPTYTWKCHILYNIAANERTWMQLWILTRQKFWPDGPAVCCTRTYKNIIYCPVQYELIENLVQAAEDR